MIRSPKQRFADNNTEAERHLELSVSPAFLRAVDAALLQMLWDTKSSVDAQAALAGFYRMTGAMDFVRTLLTLADKPMPSGKPLEGSLNWKA